MGKKSGYYEVLARYDRRDHHVEWLDAEEHQIHSDFGVSFDEAIYYHSSAEEKAVFYPCGFHRGYEERFTPRSIPPRSSPPRSPTHSEDGEVEVTETPREGPKKETKTMKLVVVKQSVLRKQKNKTKMQLHTAALETTQSAQTHTLSRKERKKKAAQLRSATIPSFCDTVVKGCTGGSNSDLTTPSCEASQCVDDGQFVLPDIVSHPICGLPADVILNVLVMYLPPQDIKTLMEASVGVNLLMRTNDHVWERVFKVQDMHRTHRDRFKKLKMHRTPSITWFTVVSRIAGLVKTREESAQLQQRQHLQRCFDSEGTAMVRALLKQKTSKWEAQEVTVYKQPVSKKQYLFITPSMDRFLRRDMRMYYEMVWNTQQCRRSEAFSKQCTCEHRHIITQAYGGTHHFLCLDCNLITHASFDRDDIFKNEKCRGLAFRWYHMRRLFGKSVCA